MEKPQYFGYPWKIQISFGYPWNLQNYFGFLFWIFLENPKYFGLSMDIQINLDFPETFKHLWRNKFAATPLVCCILCDQLAEA